MMFQLIIEPSDPRSITAAAATADLEEQIDNMNNIYDHSNQ
jgi:hypothetical protein